MSALSNWILTVVGVIVVGVLVDIVLPEGSIRKFVRGLVSIFTVFAIVAPLPNVNLDKINFGSFFKQAQIDENFIERINSKKLNEYEILIESTLYSQGYHNVDIKIDADKQTSTLKILKVNVDLTGLVLNDKNLNINKYDQIKSIVKSIVGVREEDILFYG